MEGQQQLSRREFLMTVSLCQVSRVDFFTCHLLLLEANYLCSQKMNTSDNCCDKGQVIWKEFQCSWK